MDIDYKITEHNTIDSFSFVILQRGNSRNNDFYVLDVQTTNFY